MAFAQKPKSNYTPKGRRKHSRKLWVNIAIVEGTDDGIPFRVFVKRKDKAENLARRTAGTITWLDTGKRVRYISGEWREVV